MSNFGSVLSDICIQHSPNFLLVYAASSNRQISCELSEGGLSSVTVTVPMYYLPSWSDFAGLSDYIRLGRIQSVFDFTRGKGRNACS